jgi:glycosyltransferase involved in cell wall biosynthesis
VVTEVMKNAPLVSIQTPVFNQASFIEETIRSVLGQTYENWEWIIVDDGSTDDTKDIVHSFSDKRIRYYFQEHIGIDGICDSHNKALSLSNGDFIAFIDGDDLWPARKLEEQTAALLPSDAVLSYGECRLIGPGGREIDHVGMPQDKSIAANDPVGSALKEFFLHANSFVYNPTVMVRRSALERINGFRQYTGLCHDFPTWSALAMEGHFLPLPICLGLWRKHDRSLTSKHAHYRFAKKIEFIRHLIDLEGGLIELPGFNATKEEISQALDERSNAYFTYFHYDKAMLLAKLGAFPAAEKEFRAFLRNNSSVKNHLISYLFTLSRLIHYDLVNVAGRLKKVIV